MKESILPKESNCIKTFWRIVPLYSLLIALAPFFSYPTFRGDTFEQLALSREWCLGFFRHPTLPAWILGIANHLTFQNRFTPYLAGALCTMVVIITTWRLSKEYLDSKRACFAALILTCYWYCNLGCTIIYNQNVPMAMFWILSISTFHFALVRNRLIDWILFGAALGGGFLCKYTLVFVALSAVILTLITKHRTKWRTAGPWLAVATFFLVISPHLYFFLTYFDEIKSEIYSESSQEGLFLLDFLNGWATQIGIISPLMIALCPLLVLKRNRAEDNAVFPRDERKEGASHSFILVMFLVPISIMITLQFFSRIAFPLKSYGFPLWILLPLFLLYYLPIRTDEKSWRISIILCIIFAAGELLSIPIQSLNNYYFNKKLSQKFVPAQELCRQVDEIWVKAFGDIPCGFASGNKNANYIYAWYGKDHPSLDATGFAAWNGPEDVIEKGGVILWEMGDDNPVIPENWAKIYPSAVIAGVAEARSYQKNKSVPPVRWGVALISPSHAKKD